MPGTLFADTFYWLALIDPRDDWHVRARAVSRRHADSRILTTDEVLVEVLNALSGRRPTVRQAAATNVERILSNQQVDVVPQTRDSLLAGLGFYRSRPDKGYSLTDCVSMLTMRAHGVAEVLTHDHHFEQEGFVLLLR
jgi:predicted nucleic acid-binding protein